MSTPKLPRGKAEHMTALSGNRMVLKNHPRIILRGKLDTLLAQVVLFQTELCDDANSRWLTDALEEIRTLLCAILCAEALEKPLGPVTLLGLDAEALRLRSHNPQKYYAVPPMLPPAHSLGQRYAKLNLLRAQAREVEICAVSAFSDDPDARCDIITALNRLSSALHILMCRLISQNNPL